MTTDKKQFFTGGGGGIETGIAHTYNMENPLDVIKSCMPGGAYNADGAARKIYDVLRLHGHIKVEKTP